MISRFLARVVSFLYGFFTLTAYALFAVLDGSLFKSFSKKTQQELLAARKKLWNLDHAPNGLIHSFCTLDDGTKLHYVRAGGSTNPVDSDTNLVIFIHGFPDSWAVWQHYLCSERLLHNNVLIAVDLPGYGGSDGLPKYSATAVLETITQFILVMRSEYLDSGENRERSAGRVVIVSHDWGACIALRLAAEASQLADRFVISNTMHPKLALGNVKARWSSGARMMKTWRKSPFSLQLHRKALNNLEPVFHQLYKSHYIFVFNLPAFLAHIPGRIGGHWFYRMVHVAVTGQKFGFEGPQAAELLSITLGPGLEQCGEPRGYANGDKKSLSGYPPSVAKRTHDGGYSEKIRLYREGLATGRWEQSLETLVSLSDLSAQNQRARRRSNSNAGLFESGPKGSLKAPTTVIWGLNDAFLDPRIAIDGIGDYFTRGSHVILLPKAGHWVQCEKQGAAVFEEVIAWAMEGEKTPMKTVMTEQFPDVKVTAER
ncbi:alpha/beta hydrolase [Aulographum hederae CBS 113979]|uniref:Alpha/beta hydrolase n=1 Tax=Aulographum hederae CBS 113979 TaxID=1176131 RepID=A0A6G1GT37_9PEZI|nr:alpha/beta hydrolase [Aulographum hederae CBS 113979]